MKNKTQKDQPAEETSDYLVGMEIFLEEEQAWESMRYAISSEALAPPEWMYEYEMDNLFREGRFKEFKRKLIAIITAKARLS